MTNDERNPNYQSPKQAMRTPFGIRVSSFFRISSFVISPSSFVLRASSFSRLLAEQFGDADLERWQQWFGERFFAGENAFQHQAILAAVIDLDVVVTRIDHP